MQPTTQVARMTAQLTPAAGQRARRRKQQGKHRGELARLISAAARTPRGRIGLIIVAVIVAIAAIGPFVTPHPPTYLVGIPYQAPGPGLPLGTDELGRDVLSRVLAGGWQLILMALAATAIGMVVGTAAGLTAAYRGKVADTAIMRLADVFLAFPQLVFALLLVSLIGPKIWVLVLAVGWSHAPQVARVVRADALERIESDYVQAARLLGTPWWRVLLSDVLPNTLPVIMVEVGLRLTYSIVVIAGLSFVGFGLQPPAADWGLMINENRGGMTLNPWGVLAPGILLAILTIGANLFTDAIARVGLRIDARGGAGEEPSFVRDEGGRS
jgi:peptide/nickel transport system permease protein